MKLDKDQGLQIVVRAVILRHEQLLITQWRGGYGFLIGGRVQHTEPLHEAVVREVKEETGARGHLVRLLYFSEHFWAEEGFTWHEYGWYYLVEMDEALPGLTETLPNPDHPALFIRWVPLAKLSTADLYPRFLGTYLPEDYRAGFDRSPRHIVSDTRGDQAHVREVRDWPLL